MSGTVSQFKPVASYDPVMDRVTVLSEDVSCCEVIVNPHLTFIIDNNSPTRVVGFGIESFTSFCEFYGIDMDDVVSLWEVRRVLARVFPGLRIQKIDVIDRFIARLNSDLVPISKAT